MTEMPDRYGEGMKAYLVGGPRGSCPYLEDSTERREWLAGWDHSAGSNLGSSPDPRTRKYTVSGLDELGDVHSFSTDNRERAHDIVELMRDDLEDVELIEHP